MRIVGGRLSCSPCLSAVGGGTHLDQIAQRIVVKLGIAVAEEQAAGGIIADGPVLVVRMAIGIHRDGIAPGQPPVGRAADEHIDLRGVPIREEAQERDDPDPVPGVKSHGGITGTRIDSRWC